MSPKKNRRTAAWGLAAAAGLVFLILADQFTKRLAVLFLKGRQSLILIPGILELTYVENRGMAFGMLQGAQILFLMISFVFLVFLVYMFMKIPKERRYLPLIAIGVVLGAGACGNLIDRLFRGYVVDFIFFSLIDFPVFNVADICVVCGACALIPVLFFGYRNEELLWK